jgi:hypothetical protein
MPCNLIDSYQGFGKNTQTSSSELLCFESESTRILRNVGNWLLGAMSQKTVKLTAGFTSCEVPVVSGLTIRDQ